ncbi:hypothetical protein KW782_03885 [Candidatus Parcubacteria bacterium]|nr:hypothetical protein [Candidatus Parcubacteria bacterium]
MGPIHNIIYTGAFLSKEEREKILARIQPRHKNIFAHHLTIKFRPTEEDMKHVEIGKTISLKVVGVVEDDKAQALVTETDISGNEHPHITLSTAEGVEPVYSNELLKTTKAQSIEPFTITATAGFFDGSKVVTEVHPCNTIVLPTRSQPDTLGAIFILKRFGIYHFPGIEHAGYVIQSTLEQGQNEETLRKQGKLLLDIGGGLFDHHTAKEKTTASMLVAGYLGVQNDPALQKLLQFTERDDFYGKGIISEDALDRAFGLSGLVVNLNKKYSAEPIKVVDIVLPLIEAHYDEEARRTKEMPKEVEDKLAAGLAEVVSVRQGDKKLRCIYIESDNASLPGFLRSQLGGRHDLVVQRMPSGHTNILTRPTKRVDLRNLAMVLRQSELMKANNPKLIPSHILKSEGRIPEVPEWYYDIATNSIQNGGVKPQGISPTRLTRTEIVKLLEIGLSHQL